MIDSQQKARRKSLGDDENTVELSFIWGHHAKWFSQTCVTYERACCLDFKLASRIVNSVSSWTTALRSASFQYPHIEPTAKRNAYTTTYTHIYIYT